MQTSGPPRSIGWDRKSPPSRSSSPRRRSSSRRSKSRIASSRPRWLATPMPRSRRFRGGCWPPRPRSPPPAASWGRPASASFAASSGRANLRSRSTRLAWRTSPRSSGHGSPSRRTRRWRSPRRCSRWRAKCELPRDGRISGCFRSRSSPPPSSSRCVSESPRSGTPPPSGPGRHGRSCCSAGSPSSRPRRSRRPTPPSPRSARRRRSSRRPRRRTAISSSRPTGCGRAPRDGSTGRANSSSEPTRSSAC